MSHPLPDTNVNANARICQHHPETDIPQDEPVVERVREYFFRHHRYTGEDLVSNYQVELHNYRDDTWETPQQVARLSAAVRRCKTYEVLYSLSQIADEAKLDYAPLVVKRLCAHLFDRQGNQNIIVDIFGQKGRMHCSHDSDLDVTATVVERCRQQVDDHWRVVLKNIGGAKRDYRKNQNRERGAGDQMPD